MIRSAPVTALVLTACLVSYSPLFAQDVSLEGRSLAKVTTEADLGSDLANLITGGGPDGRVGSVTVSEDRARSVTLEVTYSGFEGAFLKASALSSADGELESLSEVEAEPVPLDGSGTVRISLALSDNVPEGQALRSDFIELLVVEKAYHRSGNQSTYVMSKAWENTVRAEHVVVQVRANAMQDLVVREYPKAPTSRGSQPGQPQYGQVDPEEVEFARFRVGNQRYLVASNGGGGTLVRGPKEAAGAVFGILLGEKDGSHQEAKLLTADGWHFVAIRSDGTVDAVTPDRNDPDTRLLLTYSGDGNYFIMGQPQRSSASKRVVQPTGTDAVRKSASRALPQQNKSSIARPMLFHDGDRASARTVRLDSIRSQPAAAFAVVRKEGADRPTVLADAGNTRGPSEQRLGLIEMLEMPGFTGRTDTRGAPAFEDVLNIQPNVYYDTNAMSGVYYFVPAGYYLKWDTDREFYLDQTYFAAGVEGEPGEILVQVTLTPRVGPAQIRAAEVLVELAARRRGQPYSELRMMPVRVEETTQSIGRYLESQFQTPVSQVEVSEPSHVLDDIRLSWRMSEIALSDFVQVLRTGQALSPDLTVQPVSDELGPLTIPLYLSLDESETFGRIEWENGDYWTNEFPFTVGYRYLHALVLNEDSNPTILSWDLQSTGPVPAGARAYLGQTFTRPVQEAEFYNWVHFVVERDDASTETALREMSSSVSERARVELSVMTMNPLAVTNAYEVQVRVKSRYFEASGENEQTRILRFREDDAIQSLTLFLGRSDDIPYEYTVSVIMPDGSAHEGERWLSGEAGDTQPTILVGPRQIEQALGFVPDADSQ
jgi:hypothetical protein